MNQAIPDRTRIFSISLAHLVNDWYMNYIQTLLPFMVAAGMPVSKGAFLVSAFTITSSVLQPVSGYLVDRKSQKWLIHAGTLWMAVLLSLIGILQDYTLSVLTVSLAGLGTAAFHPQASAMVTAMSGSRKGFFQALFNTFGHLGWALTPLVVVPFTLKYGMEATPLFALPGLLVAILLWFTAPTLTPKTQKALPPPLWTVLRSVRTELSKVVLVVAVRSLTIVSLVAFLPLYLQHRNIPLVHGSRLLSLMLLMGALGGLVGGHLSDRFGRKAVIVGSLFLASPLLHLFLGTNGPLSTILMAGAGAALAASFSVTVVVAQEVIPKNTAMAAGLILGFGMGVGGLGVGFLGLMVEYAGIEHTIYLLIWLPVLAGMIGLSLKTVPSGIKKHDN